MVSQTKQQLAHVNKSERAKTLVSLKEGTLKKYFCTTYLLYM